MRLFGSLASRGALSRIRPNWYNLPRYLRGDCEFGRLRPLFAEAPRAQTSADRPFGRSHQNRGNPGIHARGGIAPSRLHKSMCVLRRGRDILLFGRMEIARISGNLNTRGGGWSWGGRRGGVRVGRAGALGPDKTNRLSWHIEPCVFSERMYSVRPQTPVLMDV